MPGNLVKMRPISGNMVFKRDKMIPNGTFWRAEVTIHQSLHGREEPGGFPDPGRGAQVRRIFILITRFKKN